MSPTPEENLQDVFNLDKSLDDLLQDTSELLAKQHLTDLEVERIIEADEYKLE